MSVDEIRVIHNVSTWLPQTATWLFNQVQYLPKEIQSSIVCDRTEHLEQFYIPNIYCLHETSMPRFFWEKGIRKMISRQYRDFLSSIIESVNAQVVHSHFGDIAWMNLKVAKKTGVKHVATFYGYDVNMLPAQDKRWLSRYQVLFNEADLFLCEGPYMAERLIELGCPEKKVRVHHLGVEVDSILYAPRSWQSSEPLKVLIAATFREKKGIPYALEALAVLQKSVPLEITIIGDATSETRSIKEKQRIIDIIEKHGLGSRIRMLGFRPFSELFEEAYKHHIFLSPSVTASDGDTEGGAPVSLIEMMATGMPIVGTSHCDIPEVVQYEDKNWLVEERDVMGLVEKLQWLIDHPDRWESMLMTGRRHVELEFNAMQQGKKLSNCYKDILVNS